MKRNDLIAFAVSPILPVFLFSVGVIVWQLSSGDKHEYGALFGVTAGLAILGLIISCFVVLVIAMPLYYFALKANKISKAFVYFPAVLLGALIIAFVWVLFGADSFHELMPALAVGALLGASAAFVFWRIIKMPNHTNSADAKKRRG